LTAASRGATDAQVLEDVERLIAAWSERQAARMPMLFSPTIGAAIAASYWFLWVRCPACRTINAIRLERAAPAGSRLPRTPKFQRL
jgi:phage FluMu protein Com